MKHCIYIIGLLLVVFIVSCNDKQPINPNPDPVEDEIRIEDYLYDYNYERQQCSQKLGYPFDIQPYGYRIDAVNNNKTIAFISFSSINHFLFLENGTTRLENILLTGLKGQDTSATIIRDAHFAPYDNNLALMLIGFRVKIGSTFQYFNEWYYYHFANKTFTRMNMDNPKFEAFNGKNVVLRWVSSSTPGNDQFFLQNNTIISYPSGNILPNPSGITLRSNEVVHSISPDMKKVFTKLNGELYLNGNKVEKSQFQFWDFLPINWSDDSQYFLGVGLEANPGAQLNIVYKMVNGSNNEFKIYRIADMMRKYCTKQQPTGFGFAYYSNTLFMSDTTFAMTLFPDLLDKGDLYEVNFKGDTLRNLTKHFR